MLQTTNQVNLNCEVTVTEARKFVRAAVAGALDGIGDKFGLDDEPEDPTEDPIPENPEQPGE